MRTLRLGSRGTDVKEVQSLLQRLGYYSGAIDGIFGSGTANGVRAFQRDYGLTVDGIVGPMTFNIMEPLLMGYSIYTIRPGDTLYKIALNYGTSVLGLWLQILELFLKICR